MAIDYSGIARFINSAPSIADGTWQVDDSIFQGLGGFVGPTLNSDGGGFIGPSASVAGYGGNTGNVGFGLGNLFGENGWLGSNVMDVLGTIGSIGSGIASYFNGQNMMNLAKEQFNFNKAMANRNMQNQAKIINNQYDSSAEVAAAMAGNRGTTTDEKIQQYRNTAKSKHVNDSWIG